MPKTAKEMSPAGVRNLTRPGLHAVGGVAGLYLQVTEGGAKSWVLRATVGTKRRDMGLGSYPTVTLAQAREKAREWREAIWQGRDPAAERHEAQRALRASQVASLTFDQAVAAYLKNKRSEFRNPKHIQQWENTLSQYASPVIGSLSVDQIELAHVVKVLEPDWQTKTETMSRLRGRIEHVLTYATVRGYRHGDNPARWRGNLDAVLPKPAKVKGGQHFKALPFADMPAFMADLRQRKGMAARALEFTILTAARSGEVRGATWDEFDLDNRLWTIPAERMKAGKEHRVPLTDGAVRLLESLPRLQETDLVFPASQGGKLSDMSLTAVLRRMKVDATVHGFRSTFRDWTAERTAYPNEVIEKCLAHAIGDKVEAAYRRGDLLHRRRRLMADWQAFCDGKGDAAGGEVVELAGGAMKRKVSPAAMVAEVRWSLALNHYRHYGDRSRISALQAEGVKSERGRAFLQHGMKRKRPRALHLPDETVVQLVFKQELQGGVPFTNWPSWDVNPCMVAVAHARGVGVSTVRRAYKRVPTHRRNRIRDNLRELLREHGALHPKHQGR